MFRPLTLLVSMAAVALAITPALSQDPAAPAAAPEAAHCSRTR